MVWIPKNNPEKESVKHTKKDTQRCGTNTVLNWWYQTTRPDKLSCKGGSLTENEYIKSFAVYYTQEVNEIKRNSDW